MTNKPLDPKFSAAVDAAGQGLDLLSCRLYDLLWAVRTGKKIGLAVTKLRAIQKAVNKRIDRAVAIAEEKK